MPEDMKPDDTDATEPVSPDTSDEESSTSEDGAETEDAAQAEGAEDETPEKDEADEGEEAKPTKGSGESAYAKLLKKYGGDQEKLAQAYWEQANSNSRLFDRLEAIEQKLSKPEPPVDVDKLVTENPDVQALNEEFSETSQRLQTVIGNQNKLIQEYGTLKETIAELKGELKHADPDEASQIRSKLDRAEQRAERVEEKVRDLEERKLSFKKDLTNLDRNIKKAEQQARELVSRQRENEQREQRDQQEVRREFVDLMKAEADSLGMDPDSKPFQALFLAVRDRIHAYLGTLPKGAPGIDMEQAVHQLVQEYADSLDLKSRFQQKSVLKRAATPTGQTKVTPATSKEPASKQGQWTRKSVDERAKRLLGS